MTAKNPNRNYAIEWILRRLGLSNAEVAAVVASGIAAIPPTDATGAVFGDVTGGLLGPLLVGGIHGSEIAPPALAADTDAYAPSGGEDALYWNLDLAGHALDGVAAPDQVGEVHVWRAVTAGTLHHDSAGTPEDGILCPGDVDLALDVDMAVVAVYLGTPNRWQIVGGGGGGGAAIELDEDGALKVAAMATLNVRHGLDADALGNLDVDESELDHSLLGSLTAGDPHTQYLLESLVDAKGDLIGATADNTPARVPVGTNGKVLTADSTTSTGVAWSDAPAAAGSSASAVAKILSYQMFR